MLHAAFENIKGLPHFGVRCVGGFSSHIRPRRTFIAYSCSQTAGQISKSVSLAAIGMSSSVDIHSSYSSFGIPSGGSMAITDGHVPAL
ncbi:hypothetical protein AVEN_141412-1 [Araneus ventricosus]|uniref:Uncharacterized protein n=1 Tax=Araneus ventricosus TaxID=182803 RepID=A0A4Y2TY18_ARAVE|nr:hypothetical protein AVEN_141412-1 [Araneus ventricosus]